MRLEISSFAMSFASAAVQAVLFAQLTHVAPDGITQTFTYEPPFSRLRRTDQSGLSSVISTFDTAGRMLTRTDGLGTTTYGYDAVTMMQETKTTICNVERA